MNYTNALEYAKKMHKTTPVRKGSGVLYITHPIAVAKILREKGFGIDVQIAGLFHDLLEETKATDKKIIAFGNREILNMVKLVTKEMGYIEKDYVNRIMANKKALAVKLADRIHNMRDGVVVPDAAWRRDYCEQSRRLYLPQASTSFINNGVEEKLFYSDFIKALEGLGDTLLS